MESLLAGIFTVTDEELLLQLRLLYDSEGIFLEPSALAGMKGPLLMSPTGIQPLQQQHFSTSDAIHLVWATGGSLVPEKIRSEYLTMADTLLK